MNAATAPSIRLATPADLAGLAALEAAAFAESWSVEQIAGEIGEPYALVLVTPDGADGLAAYAVFRHIAGEAELLRLAVVPASRRRGLARALVEAGLERLRRAGCAGCYLEVRTTNHSAITLYETLDFRRAGTRRSYYADGTDALLMHRSL